MFTMRERKTAENKQAILNALLLRIKKESFDEIKINDLCKDSSVSEASFYNYFPKKSDLLVYFVQLWSVENQWKATYQKKVDGLKAIESVFKTTTKSILDHPEIMAEIISFHAKWKTPIQLPSLTIADKIVAFPNYTLVEKIPAEGLDSIIIPHLNIAIEKGELPADTPVMTIALTLKSIFFGIPLFLKQIPINKTNKIYQEQLTLVWAGIRKQYSN